VTKYQHLMGSLIYLTTTISDISYGVGVLSRFMHKPYEGHWSTTKIVLRYLKGNQEFGLKYSKVDEFKLIGYLIHNSMATKRQECLVIDTQ